MAGGDELRCGGCVGQLHGSALHPSVLALGCGPHMTFAVRAAALRLERGAARTVAGTAGGFLALLVLVRGFEGQGAFGVLRKQPGMARLAIVLLALRMGGVIESDLTGFCLKYELRRGGLVLRHQGGQTQHRNE